MSSVTAFSGHVPQNYETYLGPLFFEPYAVDLVQRLDTPEQRKKVLEIACGTGRVTKHLVRKLGSDAALVATDLNADMLAIAKKLVKHDNVKWQTADAHELPFKDAMFDLVVCQYGVMFFQDKPKAFREIYRVLQRGGTFLFNSWNELQYNALSMMAQAVLEEIYPDDPPKFLEKGPYSFYKPAAIQQQLHEAGFTINSIDLVLKTGIAATVADAVNGILEGTPNYAYIRERSIPLALVKDRLTTLLTDHFGEKNLALPMQAFVVKATKQ